MAYQVLTCLKKDMNTRNLSTVQRDKKNFAQTSPLIFAPVTNLLSVSNLQGLSSAHAHSKE